MIRRTMFGLMTVAALTTGLVAVAGADEKEGAQKKLTEATAVYQELMNSTDQSVPKELLDHCKCVAVLPGVIKAAVGYGARHGSGVLTCKTTNGWTPPAFVNVSGGSVGLQLGAESTDLVLFFMNDRGVRSIINGSKITLGGKASVAAGPFGRSGEAATNLELKAEIYSYARSKGLFAGLSIEGARLATNKEDAAAYYGRGVTPKQLLFGTPPATIPVEAQTFLKVLP